MWTLLQDLRGLHKSRESSGLWEAKSGGLVQPEAGSKRGLECLSYIARFFLTIVILCVSKIPIQSSLADRDQHKLTAEQLVCSLCNFVY